MRALRASPSLRASADVAVVGAGIVGAAVAFHLARRGLQVALMDMRQPASGATGDATGFFWEYHQSAPLQALVEVSRRDILSWPQSLGVVLPFQQTGCLHLLSGNSREPDPDFASDVGLRWEVLSRADLKRRVPWIRWPKGDAYLFEPQAGFASPWWVTNVYAGAMEERCGLLLTETTVREISVKAGRVCGLETSRGFVSAPVVVVATGPWATGSLVDGLEGLVEAAQIDVHHFRMERSFGGAPAYKEGHGGFQMRPRGPRELFCMSGEKGVVTDPDQPPRRVDNKVSRRVRAKLYRMVAGRARGLGVRSGVDGFTEDGLPLIDEVGPDGCYAAAGFSGTGFMGALAAGRLLADLIATGHRDSLLDCFGAKRLRPKGTMPGPG